MRQGRPPKPAQERFLARVLKCSDGCWRFAKLRELADPMFEQDTGRPYVLFREHPDPTEPQVYAHIYSHRFYKGTIPPGRLVCHSCDVRNCVNPEHLWAGTQKENLDDMRRKGRERFLSGMENPAYGRSGPLSATWGRKHTAEAKRKISEKRRARTIA